MNTVEKPLALTDFRMALAGPLGPCRRPPTPEPQETRIPCPIKTPTA